MESLLVVINASAGTVDEPRVKSALDVLRAEADVQVARTSLPGELDGVLHRRGGRTLVVAGGDGSLHTVVAALHRRMELDSAVVGLIPLGTTNDFARRHGIPLDPAEAARVILAGRERQHDLLVDSRGNVVVNAVRVTAHDRSTGLRSSLLRGRFRAPLHVRVEADGQALADFDRPVGWVRVSNDHRFPATRAEVEVSFASPWDQLTSPLRSTGSQLPTIRAHATQVSVVGQWFCTDADGEPGDAERSRTWTVAPDQLRLLIPTEYVPA